MPEDQSLISNIQTIFSNINEVNYLRDLYLVCRIYRKGRIVYEIDQKPNPSSYGQISKKDPNLLTFKRPFGVVVLNLSPSVISESLINETQFQTEVLPIFEPSLEKDFHEIHKSTF
jgi:hypothetical protein